MGLTIQGVLQDATARTEAVMADPESCAYDRYIAACREEATYTTVEPGPCDRVRMTPAADCRIDYSAEIEAEAAGADEPEVAI